MHYFKDKRDEELHKMTYSQKQIFHNTVLNMTWLES